MDTFDPSYTWDHFLFGVCSLLYPCLRLFLRPLRSTLWTESTYLLTVQDLTMRRGCEKSQPNQSALAIPCFTVRANFWLWHVSIGSRWTFAQWIFICFLEPSSSTRKKLREVLGEVFFLETGNEIMCCVTRFWYRKMIQMGPFLVLINDFCIDAHWVIVQSIKYFSL